MECSIRQQTINGITDSINSQLIDSNAFEKINEEYKPISTYSEDIVNSINNNFKSNVLEKVESNYKINIPEQLIDILTPKEKTSISDNIEKYYDEIASYNVDDIKEQLSFTNEEEFFNTLSEDIDYKKSNSNVQFTMNEYDDTVFDPSTNKINLDLRELNHIAQRTNIPISQVVKIFFEHEMGHAISGYALAKGDNDVKVQEMLNAALEYHKNNPFEDILRQGVNNNTLPYPLSSTDEFMADMYGNPYFQEWAKQIPFESSNLWDKFINFIRSIIGLPSKNTLYDKALQFLNSDKIQKQNNTLSQATKENIDVNSTLLYRGQPKSWFYAVKDVFTERMSKEKTEAIFKDFDKAIKNLERISKENISPERKSAIKSLIDARDTIKGKENIINVNLNTLLQVASYAKELETSILDLESLKDENKKMQMAYSILNSTKGLQYMVPFANKLIDLLAQQPPSKQLNQFINQLRGISNISSKAKQSFNDIVSPYIITYFGGLNPHNAEAAAIRNKIDEFKKKINDPSTSEGERKLLENKLNKEIAKLDRIPIPETFKKFFSGDLKDAEISQMWLEAGITNGHPLISTLYEELKKMDISLVDGMLQVENEFQTEFDKILKEFGITQLRDVEKFWEPIRTTAKLVKEIVEKDNGDIEYKYDEQYMLLSSYTGEYLQKFSEFNKLLDFYHNKITDAREKKDETQESKYLSLHENTQKQFFKFKKENSELKYKDELYDMFELLDKDITYTDENGVQKTTTLKKEKGDIYTEIHELELKRTAAEPDDKQGFDDQIKQKEIELSQIRSSINTDGTPKIGLDLSLSQIATEYQELRNKYGSYVLTDENKQRFDNIVKVLKAKYDNGILTKEQFVKELNKITYTKIDDNYYKKKADLQEGLGLIIEKLSAIPSLTSYFSNEIKDELKKGTQVLKDLTRGFRDNEGVIDGELFTTSHPEAIKVIKDIQQQSEELKKQLNSLKYPSKEDTIRLSELLNKPTLTEEEEKEKNKLQADRQEKNDVYIQNKDLIDGYEKMLKAIMSMDDGSTSEYYDNYIENKLKEIKMSLEKRIKDKLVSNGEYEEFFRNGEQWTRKVGNRYLEVPNRDDISAVDMIASEVALREANIKLKDSDWWKDNHYNTYSLNQTNTGLNVNEKPIYIWNKTQPSDPTVINKIHPSFKFLSYKVYDENLNPDYSKIQTFISIPKKGKFVNAEFNKLKNSTDKKDIAMFKALSFLRDHYRTEQTNAYGNAENGDLLPSIIKTHNENKVETTNHLLSGEVYRNLKNLIFVKSKDEDEQFLTGGSIGNYNKDNRIIPKRFLSQIDKSKQSANVFSSILTFTLNGRHYSQLAEKQAFFEGLRSVIEDTKVQEMKTRGAKFSIGNLWSALKHDQSTAEFQEKMTEKSNVSKAMDHFMSTYIYGETKIASVIPFGDSNIDLQKTVSSAKGLMSTTLFGANLFGALKNSIAAKVASYINTNVAKGFYTASDYTKGQADTIKYIKKMMSDYRKFGNKSFEGQAIRYFQVSQGGVHNEYGKLTNWTAILDAGTGLTFFKNISEHELQVTQMFAMSYANLVEVNGKMVPFLQAYTLKNGTIALKDGAKVTEQQRLDFIKKISYINRNVNGAYRAEEKNALDKTVLGTIANYLNGYVMPNIKNRFGGERYSNEAGVITNGYWRQSGQLLHDWVKYGNSLQTTWSTLNSVEKQRVIRFVKEMGAIVSLIALYGLMGGGDSKDKLRQNNPYYNYMLAELLAVKSEVETFIPFPGMGINEIARKLNNPFAVMRPLTNIAKLLEDTTMLTVNSKTAYFQNAGVKDGFHDEGDIKAVADFIKLVGYRGGWYDDDFSVDQVQRIRNQQQIR